MDTPTLAQQLVSFMAPFLPYLLKGGKLAAKKAFETLGEQFSEESWEQAERLWNKLRPRVETKPAAREAAQDVAANPNDTDAQAALRLQLKKLLAEDSALAVEIARLLRQTGATGTVVTAMGNRSVAIGGDASGSTIITGDENKLNP